MGYLEDQRLPSERAEQEALESSPPPAYTASEHSSSELRIHANNPADHAPTSSEDEARLDRADFNRSNRDPRDTSRDSLIPSTSRDGRRVLLLIYIHGFMGDETSFQSFPAHVHNLTTELLSDSHTVHTKIYPRYRSRRAMEFARDEFSDWLSPHESPHTDVVLLGHSMGGILSAEVVLKPSNMSRTSPFVHRILGTINFDVPFLGMHPGIVSTGISSLFRKGDKSLEKETVIPSRDRITTSMTDNQPNTLTSSNSFTDQLSPTRSGTQSPAESHQASRSISQLSIPLDDPNYNPQFENDVVRPVRKGWESALHFMTKHSSDLRQATKAYVTSHVEFGGTMADYPKLHARYKRLRVLEDARDSVRSTNSSSNTPRVRFVNFYTASTGIQPKKHTSSEPGELPGQDSQLEDVLQTNETPDAVDVKPSDADPSSCTRALISHSEQVEDNTDRVDQLEILETKPIDENTSNLTLQSEHDVNSKVDLNLEDLPPIPSEPTKPPELDLESYQDKDILKLAQKEHSRKMKAYQSAVKDREHAIADRRKVLEKRQKRAAKEEEKARKEKDKIAKEEAKAAEKAAKLKEKQNQEQQAEAERTAGSTEPPSLTVQAAQHQPSHLEQNKSDVAGKEKKLRDRKFCITPTKQNGVRDPTWRRVFMEGVDEVGAHCGLFFSDKPHYEDLVNDVGNLLQEWVTRTNSTGEAVRQST